MPPAATSIGNRTCNRTTPGGGDAKGVPMYITGRTRHFGTLSGWGLAAALSEGKPEVGRALQSLSREVAAVDPVGEIQDVEVGTGEDPGCGIDQRALALASSSAGRTLAQRVARHVNRRVQPECADRRDPRAKQAASQRTAGLAAIAGIGLSGDESDHRPPGRRRGQRNCGAIGRRAGLVEHELVSRQATRGNALAQTDIESNSQERWRPSARSWRTCGESQGNGGTQGCPRYGRLRRDTADNNYPRVAGDAAKRRTDKVSASKSIQP